MHGKSYPETSRALWLHGGLASCHRAFWGVLQPRLLACCPQGQHLPGGKGCGTTKRLPTGPQAAETPRPAVFPSFLSSSLSCTPTSPCCPSSPAATLSSTLKPLHALADPRHLSVTPQVSLQQSWASLGPFISGTQCCHAGISTAVSYST